MTDDFSRETLLLSGVEQIYQVWLRELSSSSSRPSRFRNKLVKTIVMIVTAPHRQYILYLERFSQTREIREHLRLYNNLLNRPFLSRLALLQQS